MDRVTRTITPVRVNPRVVSPGRIAAGVEVEMGYGGTTFQVLAELRRKGTLAGVRNMIDLGAQEAFLNGDLRPALDLLRAFGVENPDPAETQALVDKRFVKYLWERAGIEYFSTDYDAQFETLLLDLNYEDVPPAHRNRYDLVTNCGTTEHVVNQMNSFRIIHDLTEPGGYMLHDLPWSGMYNHGLFNYKPHLFWRLCQSNYYSWAGMWLRADVNDRAVLPDNIVTYCSNKDREIYEKFFAFDGLVTVVLQKTADMPFVCPLDMEDATMVFPEGIARKRYWTLADPDAYGKIPGYAQTGFPNDEPTAEQLRDRCRGLEDRIARMEGSVFWKTRSLLGRCKRAVLSRVPGRRAAA